MILTIIISIVLSLRAETLTEAQLLKSVEENFSLIQAEVLSFEATKNDVVAADGNFDHKLKFKTRKNIEDVYQNDYFETSLARKTPYGGMDLVVGHRQGNGRFATYDNFYKTSGMGELFAGLTLPVLRNFKIDQERLDLKLSQLNQELAQEELNLKKLIYKHKALNLFYKWILETKKVEIRSQILKLAEERQEMIAKKVSAGDTEKIKINDNMRTIDKRRDELLKSQVDLQKIKTELALFLRDADGQAFNLDKFNNKITDLVTHSVDELKFNPSELTQLNLLKKQLKLLNEQKSFFKNQRLPLLNLDLLATRELSGNNPYDPQALKVGLNFELPIENRKAQGKSVSFEYKILSLQKKLDYYTNEINQLFNFSVSASRANLERFNVIKREFENSKLMAEAEKKKWLSGESDMFIFNLREQDQAEVEIKKWTALIESKAYLLDAKLFSNRL